MNGTPSNTGWARALGEFGRSFLTAFLKSSGRQNSEQHSGSVPKPSAQDRRNGQATATASRDEHLSPGRGGQTATRELTASETRLLRPSYEPNPDGDPDPGEVVWTWVPYVENDGRGKDRPVLIIARIDDETTAGCYLSTKQHRGFVSVGTGGWDSQGRESFLSPERVLRVTNGGMRREGHVLDRSRFVDAVAAVVREHGIRG